MNRFSSILNVNTFINTSESQFQSHFLKYGFLYMTRFCYMCWTLLQQYLLSYCNSETNVDSDYISFFYVEGTDGLLYIYIDTYIYIIYICHMSQEITGSWSLLKTEVKVHTDGKVARKCLSRQAGEQVTYTTHSDQ